MVPQWDGNGTYWHDRVLTDAITLRYQAKQLRRERTGLHGRLEIMANSTVVAWSNFNLERDEDRVRIANSAYPHVEGADKSNPLIAKTHFKHELDTFCRSLDGALLRSVAVEQSCGEPDRPAATFALEPYVLEGGGTLLFGPPGRGKSLTGLLWAASLDAGASRLFRVPRPRRVLGVNLERSAGSMRARLGRVNRALGLVPDRALTFIHARGRTLFEVAEPVRAAMKEHGCEALLLDSISRAGAGDLNDNGATNKITDLLNGLAETWFAIGHSPRGDSTHIYGSVHFDAAADVMVRLASQEANEGKTLGVGLQVMKANDIAKPPMQLLAYEFDAGGLARVRPARQAEFPEIVPIKEKRTADVVARYLTRVGHASLQDILRNTLQNPQEVRAALAHDGRFRSDAKGRDLLYCVRAEGLRAVEPEPWWGDHDDEAEEGDVPWSG